MMIRANTVRSHCMTTATNCTSTVHRAERMENTVLRAPEDTCIDRIAFCFSDAIVLQVKYSSVKQKACIRRSKRSVIISAAVNITTFMV